MEVDQLVVSYGVHKEILEKAKDLCQNNFADECPEWEEVKRLVEKHYQRREVIKKLVGEGKIPKVRLIDGRVAEVKKGQVVELFVHDRTQKWIRSKVIEVFEDELGNKYYLTEFHLRKHLLKDNLGKLEKANLKTERLIISFMRKAVKQPQVIVHDTSKNAILFGRKTKENRVRRLTPLTYGRNR